MKFIDVNGDSINVSKLMTSTEGLYTLFNIVSDLQDITGLNISVNSSGNLTSDGKVKKDQNGNALGSKKARDYVSGLIGSTDDINVSNDNTKATEGGGRDYVNINSNQIDDNIAAAHNAGIGDLTFGYGMSFLHESVHTATGTKTLNPSATSTISDDQSSTYPAGQTVSIVNGFRNELGLYERSQYNWNQVGSKPATMGWKKGATNVNITRTTMSSTEKIVRRGHALILKKRIR